MFKSLACATLAGLTFASTCSAQEAPNWYGGLSYGVNRSSQVDATRVSGSTLSPTQSTRALWLEAEQHAMYSAVLGAEMAPSWSLEAEWAHRSSSHLTVMSTAGPQVSPNGRNTGRFSVESLLLNGLYHPLKWGGLRPYVGFGVGPSWFSVKWRDGLGEFEDASTSFAWQVLLGTQLALSQKWSLNLQYQYLRIADPQVGGRTQAASHGGGGTVYQAYDLSKSVSNQSLQLGLRYQF